MTKRKEQEAKIRACQNSGKTAKAWCKEQSIPYTTYMGWIKRIRQEHKKQEQSAGGTDNVCSSEIAKVSSQQWVGIEKQLTAEPKALQLRCGNWALVIEEGISTELLIEVIRAVNLACY